MNDELKTKIQLIAELNALRKQVADLAEQETTPLESRGEPTPEGDTYRILLENIPAIVFRMHLRKNMNMSFYNDMLKTITGYTAEEITRDNVCSIYHLILAEDREGVLATIEQALINNQSFQVEYRLRHKDGSIRHFTEKGTPIFGDDRKPLFIDGLIVDNTEYQLTGAALRETQEKFRSLVESIGDWVWEIDSEGNYTYVSPKVTDVLGYDAASLFGKTIFDVVIPEDAEKMRRLFHETFAAKKPFAAVEKRCLHKDGRLRILEMSGASYEDSEGHVLGYRGLDRDITEHRNAEARQKFNRDILYCVNMAAGPQELTGRMTALMTGDGGFDAAAIRLHGGKTAVDYEARGLADPFLALEKHKDNLDDTQRLIRPDSRPSLEYLYGCILRGQPDPAFSGMTDGSGFRTNRLSEEPDLFDPQDRPSPLREAFKKEGYESLALIPLTADREVLGLLQIMDRRRDLFNADTIGFLEEVGRAMGQFLKKDRKVKDILVAKKRSEGRLDIVRDWIWETNQELALTYVSKQVQPMLGYGAAELFNENLLAVIPAAENEDIETFIKEQESPDQPAERKAFFKNKEGDLVPLDMYVTALLDEDGSRKGFRGICRPPATEKPAVENIFLPMVEDNPVGMYIEQEGVVKYVNDRGAETIGYEKETLIGKKTIDLLYEEDRPAFSDYYRRVMSGSEGSPCEFRIAKADGSLIWLMLAAKTTQYENNPAVMGVFMDTTSFKEKETVERQAFQRDALEKMSTGLIREIDNILSFINGYTEIAQAETTAEPLRQTLAQVALSCSRGRNLLDKIVMLTGHGRYEKGSVDLNGLARKTAEDLGKTLPTSIEIRPFITDEPCFVLADPEQVREIITQLCDNAAHAMRDKGGILKIRTERSDENQPGITPFARLAVSDNGPGIEPAEADRIFDPFWTGNPPGESSGLGLALVQALVKDLGGVLHIANKPGKGVTFTVDLPFIDPSHAGDIKSAELIPRGDERVLFIDDNTAMANLGGSLLRSLGYQTVTMTDAANALASLSAEADRFDLAVIDMTMPDIAGMDLARRIAEALPGFPLILCKGKTEIIAEAEAKRAGIREFIMKPLARKNVAAAVRKVLDEKKADGTAESAEP
jgi:PAS domain S-box-containing protein